MLVCLAAATSWAAGSFYSKRLPLPDDAFAATAYEMLIGGMAMVATGLVAGEAGDVHLSRFSTDSLLALAYLIFIGSLLAYTAYVWLLKNAPISTVATYAYVNPVIAIFLGWAILSGTDHPDHGRGRGVDRAVRGRGGAPRGRIRGGGGAGGRGRAAAGSGRAAGRLIARQPVSALKPCRPTSRTKWAPISDRTRSSPFSVRSKSTTSSWPPSPIGCTRRPPSASCRASGPGTRG